MLLRFRKSHHSHTSSGNTYGRQLLELALDVQLLSFRYFFKDQKDAISWQNNLSEYKAIANCLGSSSLIIPSTIQWKWYRRCRNKAPLCSFSVGLPTLIGSNLDEGTLFTPQDTSFPTQISNYITGTTTSSEIAVV